MGQVTRTPGGGREERTTSPVLRLDRVLHALSDPVRLGIVVQLQRDGESSCAALDGGRSKSTMSHHFRVLREAGVIQTTVQGVTHWNRLCREPLDAAFPGVLDSIISAAVRSSTRDRAEGAHEVAG